MQLVALPLYRIRRDKLLDNIRPCRRRSEAVLLHLRQQRGFVIPARRLGTAAFKQTAADRHLLALPKLGKCNPTSISGFSAFACFILLRQAQIAAVDLAPAGILDS
ncbi:hypothetical protein D3C71_1330260 [compost metagenome]